MTDPRRGVWAAIACGVTVRIAALVAAASGGSDRLVFTDSGVYLDLARHLPGVLWADDPTSAGNTLLRPPIYPTFIRLVSFGAEPRLWMVVALQCVLSGVVAVWLVHRIAGDWTTPLGATVAALVMALDPLILSHDLLIASEALNQVLVLAAMALVSSVLTRPSGERAVNLAADRRRFLGAGVLLGLATLTRPALVYFPLLAVGVAWWHPRDWRRALAIAGPMVLLIALWIGRNAIVTGEASMSSVPAQNVYYLGAAARAVDRGEMSLGLDAGRTWDEAIGNASSALDAEWQRQHPDDRNAPADDRGRVGWDAVAAHPVGAVKAGGMGLVRTMVAPGGRFLAEQMWIGTGVGSDVLLGASLLVLASEYLLAALGIVATIRRRTWRPLILLGVPALYHLLLSANPLAYSRYRIPVVPMLAVFAGIGVAAMVGAVRARRPHVS